MPQSHYLSLFLGHGRGSLWPSFLNTLKYSKCIPLSSLSISSTTHLFQCTQCACGALQNCPLFCIEYMYSPIFPQILSFSSKRKAWNSAPWFQFVTPGREHPPPVGQRSLTCWMPKWEPAGSGPPSVPNTCGTLRPPQHRARPPWVGGDLWRNAQSGRSTRRRPWLHVPLLPAWSLKLGCVGLAYHRRTSSHSWPIHLHILKVSKYRITWALEQKSIAHPPWACILLTHQRSTSPWTLHFSPVPSSKQQLQKNQFNFTLKNSP